MCRGGRLIADFEAGTSTTPDVPAELLEHLTVTVDGLWVVWAYKLARRRGGLFIPLRGDDGLSGRCQGRVPRRGPAALTGPPIPGAPAVSMPSRTPGCRAASPGRLLGADRGAVRPVLAFDGPAPGCCGGRSGRPWSASTGWSGPAGRKKSLVRVVGPTTPMAVRRFSPARLRAIPVRCG